MQKKLKYKLYGEFAEFEKNELLAWFEAELNNITATSKEVKITIDWGPKDADV